MRASSLGWRKRTRPKPSPRRMICRLKRGVSGPQGGSAPSVACAVRAALANAQTPKDMIHVHPADLLVSIATSFSSSPDIGSALNRRRTCNRGCVGFVQKVLTDFEGFPKLFPARCESVFEIAFSTPTPARLRETRHRGGG